MTYPTTALSVRLAGLLALSAAAVLPAQANRDFELPSSIRTRVGNNFPFAGSTMRFQQWYSSADVSAGAMRHCRIVGLDYKTRQAGQAGAPLDMEVRMANGPAFLSRNMDLNLKSPVVTVIPRQTITLGTSTANTWSFQLPFQNEFVYDGRSPLIVDIKIYGNGKPNNQAFQYNFQMVTGATGRTTRMAGFGPNPDSVSNATLSQSGVGLETRFQVADGATRTYGDGCQGLGRHVPVASTSGGHPVPANSAWTIELANARSQVPAVLMIGASDSMWGTTPLPLDMRVIGSVGCNLLTSIDVTRSTMTVGGGAGAGNAKVNIPIPPVTIFFAQSIYSQWAIFDTSNPGGLITSNALDSVFGG